MTEHSDISRVLRHWFDDGPSTMPDRVVDVVADRIARQPQRPARRLPRTGRPASVNARIAAAVAAAIVIGGIGLGVLLQLSREPIASQPPATSSPPSSSPTASPSAAATEPPLSGAGLVVFEHDWPLGAAPHTRLEYLLPDQRGEVLLPRFDYEQFGPSWTRDGSRLAFSGWDPREENPRELIWDTDASGSQPTTLSSPCDPPECLEEKDPGYSLDGSSIVFVRSSGEPGAPPDSTVLATRDLESGAVTELEETRRPFVGEDGRITSLRHPRWSPDGSTLLFHVVVSDADETATDSDLFVVGIDGSELRQLTPEDLLAADGEWSPDGSTILFSSKSVREWPCCNLADRHVYTIGADGTGLRQLDAAGWSITPSWTADGGQILFAFGHEATVSAQDPMVMNVDGSNPRMVAHFTDCCRWYPVQQPAP